MCSFGLSHYALGLFVIQQQITNILIVFIIFGIVMDYFSQIFSLCNCYAFSLVSHYDSSVRVNGV